MRPHARALGEDGILETKEFPLLRYRDGDDDLYFEKPATFLGRLVDVAEDCATISQGRDLFTQLYMEDLAAMFGDDEDVTFAVLLDAREHDDLVKIELRDDRLVYTNEAQAKRFA